MTTLGFDKPLYVLSFDHRDSFQTKVFGWTGTLGEVMALLSAPGGSRTKND